MRFPMIVMMSVACAAAGAAMADQPAPWAGAGDESGRAADTRTTVVAQQPNASSRGAAVPAPQRSQNAQGTASAAEAGQATPAAQTAHAGESTTAAKSERQTSATTAATRSSDEGAARRRPASRAGDSPTGQSAAAGSSALRSETADPSDARSGSRDATLYTSEDYILSRGRDLGWFGLLGLLGLFGLVRRRRLERHTDAVVSRPVGDDGARGVRVYETPDPITR